MKTKTKTFITSALLATCISNAHAATTFVSGNIETAGNWDNGIPVSGNVATISVDGVAGTATPTLNYGAGTIVNHTAGEITGSINMTSGTWNMTGGSLTGDSFKSNNQLGFGSDLNLLGGTVTATGHVGTANNSNLTIGGDVVITSGSLQLHNASPTLNFQSDWTGSWDTGAFDFTAATSWEELFTLNPTSVTYNGTTLDAAGFNATFDVTGTTLSLAAVPEPSSTALIGLGGLALILRRRK